MVFILVNDQCGGGDDSRSGRGQRHGYTVGHKNPRADLHCCILIPEDFLLYGWLHRRSVLLDVAIMFAALFHLLLPHKVWRVDLL